MDGVGDALFVIFARDFAPLAERLDAIAGRLEAVPALPRRARTRATVPQVRLWQQLEIESAADMPSFFDEIVAAGRGPARRPRAAPPRAGRATRPRRPSTATSSWLQGNARRRDATTGRSAASATTSSIGLRAFDGLDADAILAIGEEQLASNKAARVAAAREIDPDVDEADRHRPDQERPSGDLRRGARRLPRRDGPRRQHLIDTTS